MKQSVPLSIVKQANKEGLWETLCYYMWLRSKHFHKIYYNYTSRTIGKELGISHTQANYHIRVMLRMGLAKNEGKHLRLLSNKSQDCLVNIPIYATKREQIVVLKNILINRNLLLQQKAINKKTKIVHYAKLPKGKITSSDMKLIKKSRGVDNLERSINSRTTLSNDKIGEILAVSKREASRLQVQMVKMGLLKASTYFEWCSGDIFNLPPNIFIYKGYLVKRCSNTLSPIIYKNFISPLQ